MTATRLVIGSSGCTSWRLTFAVGAALVAVGFGSVVALVPAGGRHIRDDHGSSTDRIRGRPRL